MRIKKLKLSFDRTRTANIFEVYLLFSLFSPDSLQIMAINAETHFDIFQIQLIYRLLQKNDDALFHPVEL